MCREKFAPESADYAQLLGSHASSQAAELSTETLTLLLTFDGYLLDDSSSSLLQQLETFGYRQVSSIAKEDGDCYLLIAMMLLLCV